MNVFKYIKISFVLFFIFTIGENAYSQREIQPFENQFTYDYALKYYGNLNMKNSLKNNWYALYFFLENFKASPGIKHIEEGNMAYLDDVHYKYSSKRNYYYNEQGFLNKIVMITWVKNNDDQQFIKTEKIINEFEYKFTKEMIFIKNKNLCLFQSKSIPLFHSKSIPLLVNKKGYFDLCWGYPIQRSKYPRLVRVF